METKPVPPETPGTAESSKKCTPFDILGEVAKFTIFGAFLLYMLGFLIWQSYLESYYLSLGTLFQVEFLSAALCYLYYSAVVVIPCFLLYARSTRREKTELPLIDSIALAPLSILYSWVAPCPVVSFVILAILCVAVMRFRGRLKTFAYIFWLVLLLVGPWIWGFLVLGFLWRTLLVVVFLLGIYSQRELKPSLPGTKCVVAMALLITLLFHVGVFGRTQFPLVKRGLGGGKPDSAYLTLSRTNAEFTNVLVGPVRILLRSDKEILFVEYPRFPQNEGNTNAAAKNPNQNSLKQNARQIRADLVECLTFTNIALNNADNARP